MLDTIANNNKAETSTFLSTPRSMMPGSWVCDSPRVFIEPPRRPMQMDGKQDNNLSIEIPKLEEPADKQPEQRDAPEAQNSMRGDTPSAVRHDTPAATGSNIGQQGSNLSETPRDSRFECDYDKNPTELFLDLQKKDWEKAEKRTTEIQARTWVSRKEKHGKLRWRLLPLHAAIIFKAPEKVVENLLAAYPKGAQSKDDQGMLPLHLAFRHGSSEGTVNLLLVAFPQSVEIKDRKGRIPLVLAQASASPNRDAFVRALERGPTYYANAAAATERAAVTAEQRAIFDAKLIEVEKKHQQDVNILKEERKGLNETVELLQKELAKQKGATQVLVDHVNSLESQLRNKGETERFLAVKAATLDTNLKEVSEEHEMTLQKLKEEGEQRAMQYEQRNAMLEQRTAEVLQRDAELEQVNAQLQQHQHELHKRISEIEELMRVNAETIGQLKQENAQRVDELKRANAAKIEQMTQEREELKRVHATKMAELKAENAADMAELKAESTAAMDELKEENARLEQDNAFLTSGEMNPDEFKHLKDKCARQDRELKSLKMDWASAQARAAVLEAQLKSKIENEHELASQVSHLAGKLAESAADNTAAADMYQQRVQILESERERLRATVNDLGKKLLKVSHFMNKMTQKTVENSKKNTEEAKQKQLKLLEEASNQEKLIRTALEERKHMAELLKKQEEEMERSARQHQEILDKLARLKQENAPEADLEDDETIPFSNSLTEEMQEMMNNVLMGMPQQVPSTESDLVDSVVESVAPSSAASSAGASTTNTEEKQLIEKMANEMKHEMKQNKVSILEHSMSSTSSSDADDDPQKCLEDALRALELTRTKSVSEHQQQISVMSEVSDATSLNFNPSDEESAAVRQGIYSNE